MCANTCNAVQSNTVESCGVHMECLWGACGVHVQCTCNHQPIEVCAAYWDDEEQVLKIATYA